MTHRPFNRILDYSALRKFCILVTLFVGYGCLNVVGAPVSFSFAGTISYVKASPWYAPGSVVIGDPFFGAVQYDPSFAEASSTSEGRTLYKFASTNLALLLSVRDSDFDSRTSERQDLRLVVVTNAAGGTDEISIQADRPSIDGVAPLDPSTGAGRWVLFLKWTDKSGTALNDTQLPTDASIFDQFPEAYFEIRRFDALIGNMFLATGASIKVSPGSVVREPLAYLPEASGYSVALRAIPAPGTSSYAIEETIPISWQFAQANESGTYSEQSRSIRWGPFFDDTPRVLTYQINQLPIFSTNSLHGIASFDGSKVEVVGTRNLYASLSFGLNFTRTKEGHVRLTWLGSWHLQQALAVSGPWTDLSVTGTSYQVEPSNPKSFFRLRSP